LAERRGYWESIHGDEGYENVISLTDDPAVCERIERALEESRAKRILVPGCGSRTGLQEWLVGRLPQIEALVCTDFPAVVALGRERFSHPSVEFQAADSGDLPWREAFDAAVVVNSILSESDRENRRVLSAIRRALRPDGVLVGFFPTVFATLDIATISHDPRRHADLDLERSMKYEPAQEAFQIFYTPLRLRLILREAGFDVSSMEIYFLDSDHIRSQPGEWNDFSVEDEDLVIYELYVVARAKS
jgi:SAM-dependent methyltransferase